MLTSAHLGNLARAVREFWGFGFFSLTLCRGDLSELVHVLDIFFFFFRVVKLFFKTFLQLYYPNGTSPMKNSGCLPRGKPAATESCYPTYGARWVF